MSKKYDREDEIKISKILKLKLLKLVVNKFEGAALQLSVWQAVRQAWYTSCGNTDISKEGFNFPCLEIERWFLIYIRGLFQDRVNSFRQVW